MAATAVAEAPPPSQTAAPCDGAAADGRRRRAICGRCARPATVCLCAACPPAPLETQGFVIVVQHPLEARRRLATAPLLPLLLRRCAVARHRRVRAWLAFWESRANGSGGHSGHCSSNMECGRLRHKLLSTALFPLFLTGRRTASPRCCARCRTPPPPASPSSCSFRGQRRPTSQQQRRHTCGGGA